MSVIFITIENTFLKYLTIKTNNYNAAYIGFYLCTTNVLVTFLLL